MFNSVLQLSECFDSHLYLDTRIGHNGHDVDRHKLSENGAGDVRLFNAPVNLDTEYLQRSNNVLSSAQSSKNCSGSGGKIPCGGGCVDLTHV